MRLPGVHLSEASHSFFQLIDCFLLHVGSLIPIKKSNTTGDRDESDPIEGAYVLTGGRSVIELQHCLSRSIGAGHLNVAWRQGAFGDPAGRE